MTLPEKVQRHLEQADLAAIEDEWLARISAAPDDLPFFVETARAVAKIGEPEHARLLLEMLDEELVDGERWRRRLELLRDAGRLLFDPGELHPAILDTLRRIYHDRPSLDGFIDKVGLLRAVDDIPKTWKKADRLEALLRFDVGTIVHMKGKGAGRVTEANMALGSFTVDLERLGPLKVGFAAAAKLLAPLDEDHILRRKLEQPEELEALRDRAPGELLRLALESYDEPRTGGEIRQTLAGIVADDRWSSFWATARKHPQVVAGGKGRRSYTWSASSADAQDEIWGKFERAAPRARIELLRRDGDRDAGLRARMVEHLSDLAAEAADDDPSLAAEIWLALERQKLAAADVPWAAPELIATSDDPRRLAAGIEDRGLRQRGYRLIRKRRDDWAEIFARLLWTESEPRVLDDLATSLAKSDGILQRELERLIAQPRKAPAAFTWLAERAAEHPSWRRRNPLRFLTQILWALADKTTFGKFRVRLAKTVESGSTVPRLLGDLSEEQAEPALAAVVKNAGLESYQREALINAIHLRFPHLREDDSQPLYATPAAITAKRAELKKILEEEIPQNRRAIQTAREMGDLRENFEYKSARQRHEYLTARAQGLDSELERARKIDFSQVQGTTVVIGSRLKLRGDGGEREITILGPWDSDPENGVLSNESELAQQLLGKPAGAEVEIGDESYRIVSIEPWAEA